MQSLLRRKGWTLLSFATLFVGLIAFLLLVYNVAQAQPNRVDANDCLYHQGSGPWLGHCPERVPLSGSSYRTGMMVGGITDLQSVQGTLNFDPQYLEIVQTRIPRRNPANDPCAVVPKLVTTPDNNAGTLNFSAEFDPPLADGCTVFLIDWRIKEISATGVTTPTFSAYTMIDSQGREIPHHTKPPTDGCVISGKVLLEGRANHSGTHVILSTEQECPSKFTFSSLDVWPGTVLVDTDARGDFTLDSGGQPCRCLLAVKQGYLTALGKPPMKGQVVKADKELLAGDATADDAINVFDLALIASFLPRYDPECDINGDDKCDIYDLALAANNQDKRGPQDWP